MTNDERSAKAMALLRLHCDDWADGDPGIALTDLLSDLRHMAFLRGIDYAAADHLAAQHFRAEIDDAADLEDELGLR